MSTSLAPVTKQRWLDANGAPLAGGLIYTYQAGSTTPLATYTDQTGSTPNSNPVILDSQGYADIWLSQSSYKFVVKDSSNATIYTTDNISYLTTIPANTIVGNNTAFPSVPLNLTVARVTGMLGQISTVITALYDRIVGSATQVTAGLATDSTIASAITNATAGQSILILEGTYIESPTINKKLNIEGRSEGSIVQGTLTLASGSDYTFIEKLKFTANPVINSGVVGTVLSNVFLSSGISFTDNSGNFTNFCQGMQEA